MGEQQHTLSFLGNENYKFIFTEGNSVLPYLYSCEIPTKYSFPTVAKNDLWNRVCWSLSPSVCPFVCQSRCFLGIEGVFLEFSKVWHGFRNSFEVVHHRAKFFGKTFYAPRMGKKGFFLKLLVNLVFHFFLICPTICSVVKLYPIICVPAQIPYLGKIWFPKYGLKWSLPIILQDFWISCISRRN